MMRNIVKILKNIIAKKEERPSIIILEGGIEKRISFNYLFGAIDPLLGPAIKVVTRTGKNKNTIYVLPLSMNMILKLPSVTDKNIAEMKSHIDKNMKELIKELEEQYKKEKKADDKQNMFG